MTLQMASLRPIIYNLHRLIERCASPSPTGVDRVDLRHALHIIKQASERQLFFIYQRKNVAYHYPLHQAQALLANIEQRWVYGEEKPPYVIRSKASTITNWPKNRLKQATKQLLPTELKNYFKNNPSKPIYMHGGHGTIHHLDLHQQIKQQLQADLVFYLHDLIPIDFPEYTQSPNAKLTHQRRLRTMAETGSLILANSEDSKQRFLSYCAQQNLPKPPVHTLLIGVEPSMLKAANEAKLSLPDRFRRKLDRPYFITIGTIEARKNHLLLLQIWRQLAAELGDNCPQLVILGKRGWNIEGTIHLLDKCPALQNNHIVEINDATDQNMTALLQHACALLFPSFAEGWGMPLAESLTLGTNALCSDIPALRECGQNQAIYLDTLDGLGWKQAILEVLSSPLSKPNYQPDLWHTHLANLDRLLLSLE